MFDSTAVRTSNLANPHFVAAFYTLLLFFFVMQTETYMQQMWCLVHYIILFVGVVVLCLVFIITLLS